MKRAVVFSAVIVVGIVSLLGRPGVGAQEPAGLSADEFLPALHAAALAQDLIQASHHVPACGAGWAIDETSYLNIRCDTGRVVGIDLVLQSTNRASWVDAFVSVLPLADENREAFRAELLAPSTSPVTVGPMTIGLDPIDSDFTVLSIGVVPKATPQTLSTTSTSSTTPTSTTGPTSTTAGTQPTPTTEPPSTTGVTEPTPTMSTNSTTSDGDGGRRSLGFVGNAIVVLGLCGLTGVAGLVCRWALADRKSDRNLIALLAAVVTFVVGAALTAGFVESPGLPILISAAVAALAALLNKHLEGQNKDTTTRVSEA